MIDTALRAVVTAATSALLVACGSSGSSPTTPVPPTAAQTALNMIARPTSVNLYPVQSAADGARLFIKVTAVGAVAVTMPLGFDTGSAGVTLYAPAVLPADLASTSGFNFAGGQTTLTYRGITVTNQKAQRSYGGPNGPRTAPRSLAGL